MSEDCHLYPFSAIVGQEKMKKALLVNAVDPGIGGLLIKGERGTAKSSAARSLAELLPAMDVVAYCPFSCDPHDRDSMCDSCRSAWDGSQPLAIVTRPPSFVTLPLNATEDRVVGTFDLERALKEGAKRFEAGILAAANRSILYVDEVNLLDDHIVDILLDAAAMGVNIVEREGISYRHPASFLLIGSMNPEEGDLRPQLEDRFGLCVEVRGEADPAYRVEIMRRLDEFTSAPDLFRARFETQQQEVRETIASARSHLFRIELSDGILEMVSSISLELDVCGHRADIATCRAARALAALEEKTSIDESHVREAAGMAFPHRLRKTPFDEAKGMERLQGVLAKKKLVSLPKEDATGKTGPVPEPLPFAVHRDASDRPMDDGQTGSRMESKAKVTLIEDKVAKSQQEASGRRSVALTDCKDGRMVGQKAPEEGGKMKPSHVAIDATLKAAALRSTEQGKPFAVEKQDLRKAVRKRKVGNLILFVLDASASMGARERIESTREVVSDLLVDAYQKRDKVGLITFRDEAAQLVLAPTSSLQMAKIRLKELATGGATPLSHGLAMGLAVAKRELARSTGATPLLVLVTDGYGNVPYASSNPVKESLFIAAKIRDEKFPCVVFDTSNGGSPFRRERVVISHARRIADTMGARYYALAPLKPEDMIVRLENSLMS